MHDRHVAHHSGKNTRAFLIPSGRIKEGSQDRGRGIEEGNKDAGRAAPAHIRAGAHSRGTSSIGHSQGHKDLNGSREWPRGP